MVHTNIYIIPSDFSMNTRITKSMNKLNKKEMTFWATLSYTANIYIARTKTFSINYELLTFLLSAFMSDY